MMDFSCLADEKKVVVSRNFMALTATVGDYKFVHPRYRNLITGYIHEVQSLFPFEQNPYYNIPVSINHLCAVYYNIRGAFSTKFCATFHLKLIDETTVTKSNCDSHALCVFGEPITSSMCNIFRIEYKVLKAGLTDDKFCPYFGFATASSTSYLMSALNKTQHWSCTVTQLANRRYANVKAYGISMYNEGSPPFRMHGKGATSKANRISTKVLAGENMTPHVGDTFMLVHNFKTSKCTAFFGETKLHTFMMKEKCIIPTLSLFFKGVRVKVTKYEFE